jgi:hypothetical protein
MQSSSSPNIVNIIPLANINTTTSGINPVTQLANTVANLQEMVNYDKKAIYTNYLGAFPGGNTINVLNQLNLCNVGILSNGSLTSFGSLASGSNQTNIIAESIVVSTITVGGTCYAQSYVTLSDKGVKGDLRMMPTISFDTLSSVNTYRFKYVGSDKDEIGLVAQELEAVYPECISHQDHKKYVNYPSLVAVLLRAVKDLDERVRRLEAEG